MQTTIFICALTCSGLLSCAGQSSTARCSWPEIERQIQRHRDRVRWCGPLSAVRALRQRGHDIDATSCLARFRNGDSRGIRVHQLLTLCRDYEPQARLVSLAGKQHDRLSEPSILLVNKDSHAIVFQGWSRWRQTARIWDPSDLQLKTVTLDQLDQIWTGNAILLDEPSWVAPLVGMLSALVLSILIFQRVSWCCRRT